jgi:hypothetical protein
MEKYFVFYTSNGNFAIEDISEHGTKNAAIAKYHDVLHLMWADATVQTASVVILDAFMNRVENYHEDVSKVVQAQPTPEPTEE